MLREADAIVQEEVRAAGLERELWQAFAVLLPVHTVGVMGDFRTYGQVIALRAVTSQDAMTADWARLALRPAGPHQQSDHERGPGHQPRRLRRLVEAAEHHRVGVDAACSTPSSSTSTCTPSTASSTARPSSTSSSRRPRPSTSRPSPSPTTATSSAPSTSTSPPRRPASSPSSAASCTSPRGAGRSGLPGRRLRGRQPPHGARPQRGRLPEPHQARLQGLPRGLLLQAARGQGTARRATPTGSSCCRGA